MSPLQTRTYWRLWRDACRVQGWTQSDREQRMAVHRMALGRDKSSKQFTNTDVDRIYAQLRLLIDPDDLTASMRKDAPEMGQKKRYLYALSQIPEALVIHICNDKFGTRHWRNLNPEQLQQLLMTCKRAATAEQARRVPVANQYPTEQAIEALSIDDYADSFGDEHHLEPVSATNDNQPF